MSSLNIQFRCMVLMCIATNSFCRRIKNTSVCLKRFVILLFTILDQHIVSLRPDDIYVMYLLLHFLTQLRDPSNVSQYSSVKITVDRSISMYWINTHFIILRVFKSVIWLFPRFYLIFLIF